MDTPQTFSEPDSTSLRIVLVHDWLTGMRGGEKVLEILARQFPQAPLFTLLHKKNSVSPIIEQRALHTSFLQNFPRVDRYYRYLLPLMPWAVNWKLPDCDLVISSSHCVAKSVIPPKGVPHLCYCYTPMRYAWHLRESYGWRGLKGWAIHKMLDRLREWDRRTADRVTHFVAISQTVQQRIRDCYQRSSVVIYPPVDTEFYCPAPIEREDYFLVLSALVPYKRLDLAIQCCNRLQKKLVVIGSGPEEGRLKKIAGPTVQFLGWLPDLVVRDHLRKCRALLFPGEEDFGIVPVEAQACGTPVIALNQGGARETVLALGQSPTPTGILFDGQKVESMMGAIETLEKNESCFQKSEMVRHAQTFCKERFLKEIMIYLQEIV